MINGLKPYPSYKDSGVPWLGAVPEHWEMSRLKGGAAGKSFAIVDGPFGTQLKASEYRDAGVPLIRVKNLSYEGRFLPRGLTYISEDKWVELVRSSVGPGDLVVAKTGATIGKCALVPAHMERALIASSCIKASLNQSWLGSRFAMYVATSPGFQGEIIVAAGGSTRDTINIGPFGCIVVPVPLLLEQAAIVRFLGHVDQRIRRYIRAKQKLIKLLEEQKQAIIHRAVTGQIDVRTGKPYPAYKPSGVEWLGDVPEHWDVSRVKNELFCLNRRRVPLSATERGVMTLRLYDYYGASGVIDKVDEYLFDDDLLLIAEDGANLVLRSLPLAIIARGKFWVNNHAHILKPRRGNVEFLAAVMERTNYQPWISGAAQPKLTQDRLMGIAIAVAPPEEQDWIVKALSEETAPLRAAIERFRREIDLLREFRTRLTADVVTGKLDVREAAVSLPEEPGDLEQGDELEDTLADASEVESHEDDSEADGDQR